jgi:hypothetical protein
MDIAQRGTSFANAINGTGVGYILDRWRASVSGMASFCTVSQQADVPSNNEFQNSLRVAVTTADTSITSAKFAVLTQPIEGYNVRDLIGKTFTVSFWVRSSKTGIHCIALRNSGSDRTWVSEYNINSVNTWEKKTVTVSGGLVTAGTWNWTNGVGLDVCFVLASGSTYQTAAGIWQTGSFFDTVNQVNCLDTVGNIFAITGVQLEVGSVGTAFEHRDYNLELTMAQRYFCKLVTGNAGAKAATSAGTWHAMDIFWPTNMRIVPIAGNIVLSNLTYVTCSSAVAALSTATHVTITVSTSGAVTYTLSTITIDASAEL